MADDLTQDDNPYASPDYSCPAGVGPDGRIYPTRAPADVLDVAIVVLYMLFLIVIVLGIPTLLMILAVWSVNAIGRLDWAVSLLALLITVPVTVWFVWFFRTEVRSLAIDDDGIHLLRRLSRPDDWPWGNIIAIRPATRWEVLWDGCLRPLYFPRERTSTMSLLGHYRIQGKTDYCFFPPKNPEAFVEAIARHRPDLLEPPGQTLR